MGDVCPYKTFNHGSCIIKSTVALVLAGGKASEFGVGNVSNFKALLPVCGRPIADYVIQALEQSNVEKIFIIQDEDANLQETLTPSSKSIFLKKDGLHASLGIGILYALEKVAEYYGDLELNKKTIMIVPCDTPLVTKDHFNRLIHKAGKIKSADFIFTIIAANPLKKQYPQRRFYSVYLSEYKTNYTMQNVNFMNGEFIKFKPSEEPGKLKISFRGWDEELMEKLEEEIDSIGILRRQPHFYEKYILRWLINKKYISYALRYLANLTFNRFTIAKAIEFINTVCHLQAGFIESEDVEFSCDIDRPEDFQMVLGAP